MRRGFQLPGLGFEACALGFGCQSAKLNRLKWVEMAPASPSTYHESASRDCLPENITTAKIQIAVEKGVPSPKHFEAGDVVLDPTAKIDHHPGIFREQEHELGISSPNLSSPRAGSPTTQGQRPETSQSSLFLKSEAFHPVQGPCAIQLQDECHIGLSLHLR